ncbi:uncharacterized protein LOC111258732 isoform X2 [Varroa jacobsoni]|uniref:uncharacterized protein LOC111258732 isoform X2 n=1 Tax=Varroa jacobsoni TaxID=62625 RepID=UPI000BF598C1|nr:uncharacterized protein LOC111258732 isoform X2 [Varroa jacobsoni]
MKQELALYSWRRSIRPIELSIDLFICLSIGVCLAFAKPIMDQHYRKVETDDLPPSITGYDEFEMKALDGFQVTSHEVSDDENEDPIIVVPLQRVNSTNFFRFQRNPASGEYLVGFKPNSFLVMMHPRHGRDLRAFVCLGKEFLDCDGETILRYLRRFDGLEGLIIDFKKKTAKLKS